MIVTVLAGCDGAADASGSASGGGSGSAAEPSPVAIELARLDPPQLDLGEIQYGTGATGSVRLVNDGTEPLRVERTATSCGCTVVDFPREPIAPGEFIEVAVKFRPTGAPGSTKTKSVKFFIKGVQKPLVLPVSATLAQLVQIQPGIIDSELTEDRQLIVSSTDETAFRITKVVPAVVGGALDATAKESHRLTLSADRWLEQGSPKVVRFELDHPKAPSIVIAIGKRPETRPALPATVISPVPNLRGIAAVRAEALQVRPRRVDFGTLVIGEAASRTIRIERVDGLANTEPTISSALGAVLSSWKQENGALVLEVELTPSESSGGRIQQPIEITYGDRQGEFIAYVRATN